MTGIRYLSADEIKPVPWQLQGTVYPKLQDAKFAALKLFCINTGVRVKRVGDGWTLLFWRKSPVTA